MTVGHDAMGNGERRSGWWLSCPKCGTGLPIGMYNHGCPTCHARGDVEALHVDYAPMAPYPDQSKREVGIWNTWGDWLPALPAEHRITLGEGNTPLLRVEALCRWTGIDQLYLKMEPQNPTGAHKDRFHAVNVAMAKALGMRGVVALSTGNHGLSMSAYAAAHGLQSVVIANEGTPL